MSRQRGSTWQADAVLRDGRRLRPGGFQSEAAANLWEAQTAANDALGLPPPPLHGRNSSTPLTLGITLGELRSRVLATGAPDGWRGSKAFESADKNSHHVVKFFGSGKMAAQIDVNEVDRFVTSLDHIGNSGGTVNRKLAALSKMLKFAYQRKLITSKPHIARQQEAEGRLRYLTWEEDDKAIAAFMTAGHIDLAHLTGFLIDTGARVSEALALQPAHYSTKPGGVVTFMLTKGRKPRSVPLTDRARIALDACEFSSINYWRYRSAWDTAKKRLGTTFDDVVIHTFRHTCASRLVQGGVDLYRVMKWMGHKDIQTTLRYAHLAPKDLHEGVGVLERSGNKVEQAGGDQPSV